MTTLPHTLRVRALRVLAASALLVACGSDGSSSSGGLDGGDAGGAAGLGGGAGSGGSGAGGAAGAGGGGGTSAAAGAAGSPPAYEHLGRVTLGVRGAGSVSLVAWFDTAAGHGEREACTGADCVCHYESLGECWVNRCEGSAAPPPVNANAGRLIATNLRTGVSVEVAPDPATGEYPTTTAFPTFEALAGDRLQVSAIGAEVPAFSATLAVSEPITVLEPVATSPFFVDRAAPFIVRWGAGPLGVRVDLSTEDSTLGLERTLLCVFDGGPRRGTVPAVGLGELVATPSGRLSVYATAVADVPAGDWLVRVQVVTAIQPLFSMTTEVR